MKTIFSTLVGSRLYGTHMEDSDWDVKAVALPSAEDLLGLEDLARKHWDRILDDGEETTYSVTKFLSLFKSGNPTVTELVFACPVFHRIPAHPVWKEVKDFALDSLLSDSVVSAYRGYVKDQFYRVSQRKAQNNREFMLVKFGYDVKCSGHVYRLAHQGYDLVTTGKCDPTLSGDTLAVCRSIRSGEKTYEETMELLKAAVDRFLGVCDKSVLVHRDVEQMTADTHRFVFDLHMRVVKGLV